MQQTFRLAALAAVSLVVASSDAQQWGGHGGPPPSGGPPGGPPGGMGQGPPDGQSGSWGSHGGGPPAEAGGPPQEGWIASTPEASSESAAPTWSSSAAASSTSSSSSFVSTPSSSSSSLTSSSSSSSLLSTSSSSSSSVASSSAPSPSPSSSWALPPWASSWGPGPPGPPGPPAPSSSVPSIISSADVTTSVVFVTASTTISSCPGDDCTTSVDFTTAQTTVTPSGSASMTNSAAVSSAFNAAWGGAESSFVGSSSTSTSSTSAPAATTSSSDYGPPAGPPDGPPPADAPQGYIGWQHGEPPPNIFTQGLPSNFPSQAVPSASSVAGPSEPAQTADWLTSPISNNDQVGDSYWGTLDQPTLGQWLNGNGGPDYDSAPWGDYTVQNSDASVATDAPTTNVTRYYNFTITRSRISADGVLRDVILVNDQFPGPLIEANWGDWVQVTVNNQIYGPEEGTSMHWHGMLQRLTPWQDGVPSIAQCPIPPGSSLTYTYKADIYGTTWYHSHFSAQMAAGVAGPLVVHGPSSQDYDIDIGPVMLSDWYHIPYFAIVADAVGTNYSVIPPTSDSVLINGRGQFDCDDPSYSSQNKWLALNWNSNITWTCSPNAPLSQFRFQSGKVHRLRLINHGANGVQKFSIDGHKLTVIATDLVPNVPYETDVVTLGVGQRTDILVTATSYPQGAVWMRAELPGGEPCGGSSNPLTLAAIYYEEADTTLDPTTEPSFNATSCLNDELVRTTPEYSITPSTDAWTQDLSLTLELNATGHFEFQINSIAYKADYNHPVLPQVASGNLTTAREWNVYDFGNNKSIILNITNNMPLTHPFHLHGHNFYVLNFGDNSTTQATSISALNADTSYNPNAKEKRQAPTGPTFSNGAIWDGSVINPSNPMRRDTLLVPSYGFAAIQFDLNNPGLWPFHCHIAWHLSAGQVMNILYRPQDMIEIPANYTEQTCTPWASFSAQNGVSQIDSGG